MHSGRDQGLGCISERDWVTFKHHFFKVPAEELERYFQYLIPQSGFKSRPDFLRVDIIGYLVSLLIGATSEIWCLRCFFRYQRNTLPYTSPHLLTKYVLNSDSAQNFVDKDCFDSFYVDYNQDG